MSAGALDSAGLESTFHGVLPGSSTTGRNGPRFKRPGILEKASEQVNFQPAFPLNAFYGRTGGRQGGAGFRVIRLATEIKEGDI